MHVILFFSLIISSISYRPLIIGKYGTNSVLPNTLESFKTALDTYHYDGLYTVLKVTKDDKFVVYSDNSIITLEGLRLSIPNTELNNLLAYEIKGRGTHAKQQGKLCTLEEFFQLCKEKAVLPMIEIRWLKGMNRKDMSKFSNFLEIIRKYDMEEKVILVSPMRQLLEEIKKDYKKINVLFLTYKLDERKLKYLEEMKINPIVRSREFKGEEADKVREKGLEIAVWGVKTENDYKTCAADGANIVVVEDLNKENLPEVQRKEITVKKNENKDKESDI